jgi:hypothetical protein
VGHGRSGEFALALARGGPVEVQVFNVAGQMVAILREERSAGRQAWRWNGRMKAGGRAASGVYFFHFRLPDGVTADRRSVVLR